MPMLHLTRALFSAVVTCATISFLLLGWNICRWRSHPSAFPDSLIRRMFSQHLADAFFVSTFVVMLVSGLMFVLWCRPAIRHWLRRSWVATIAGAIFGASAGFLIYLGGTPNVTMQMDFDRMMINRKPYAQLPLFIFFTSITGALASFLHAFLIQRAHAKKAWLESHPEPGRYQRAAGP